MGYCVAQGCISGRVARPARPHLTGTAAILAAYRAARTARCVCPAIPLPSTRAIATAPKRPPLHTSNTRNRLRPQAPSGNRYQNSGNARMADTKLASALVWYDSRRSPVHLSERRRSETLPFFTSNQRNRLCPQAPSVNQPRANKEKEK